MVGRRISRSNRSSGWSLFSVVVAFFAGSSVTLFFSDSSETAADPLWLHRPSSGSSTSATGWKNIHVFYNKRPALGYQKVDWFSQARQDEIVHDLVGDNGFFVDLAANHAAILSNTIALEKRGWNGICIEPNSEYWYSLSHRNCHVVGAPVAGSVELVDFKFSARGEFGGIEKTLNKAEEKRLGGKGGRTEKRYTVPLEEVLSMFHTPSVIDYLSLDVEGAEFLIMQHFPFHLYTIRVMTVERPDDSLKSLLQSNGYILLKEISHFGETLWAHESMGLSPTHPRIAQLQRVEWEETQRKIRHVRNSA